MAKITSDDIRRLLEERFSDTRQYAVAHEVGNSTGLSQFRRIDMVVVNCYESNNFALEGIEIKVSKSDLRSELQHSEKHNIFFRNLDYFSLVCPAEILDIDLIPKTWGIYTVKDGKLKMRRRPLSLHDEGLHSVDKGFLASLIRSINNGSPNSLKNMINDKVREEYRKGYTEGRKSVQSSRVQQELEELQSYRKLMNEISIYSAYGADKALQEFREFRDLDLKRFETVLTRMEQETSNVLNLLHSTRKAITLPKEIKEDCS